VRKSISLESLFSLQSLHYRTILAVSHFELNPTKPRSLRRFSLDFFLYGLLYKKFSKEKILGNFQFITKRENRIYIISNDLEIIN